MTTYENTDLEIMTKAERTELAKVVRMQAKVAKTRIEQRKAEALAELEEELASEFAPNEEAWKQITAEAETLIKALDSEIAGICEARGIRPEFRPSLRLAWMGRGQNAEANRRAELRKVGQTKAEAMAREARAQVEVWSADSCTQLVAGGLTTNAARAFLEAVPSADVLLPSLEIAALEAETGR